jgi:hypothetical protein
MHNKFLIFICTALLVFHSSCKKNAWNDGTLECTFNGEQVVFGISAARMLINGKDVISISALKSHYEKKTQIPEYHLVVTVGANIEIGRTTLAEDSFYLKQKDGDFDVSCAGWIPEPQDSLKNWIEIESINDCHLTGRINGYLTLSYACDSFPQIVEITDGQFDFEYDE